MYVPDPKAATVSHKEWCSHKALEHYGGGVGGYITSRDLDFPIHGPRALAVAVEVVDAEAAVTVQAAATARIVNVGVAIAVPAVGEALLAVGSVARAIVEDGKAVGVARNGGPEVELSTREPCQMPGEKSEDALFTRLHGVRRVSDNNLRARRQLDLRNGVADGNASPVSDAPTGGASRLNPEGVLPGTFVVRVAGYGELAIGYDDRSGNDAVLAAGARDDALDGARLLVVVLNGDSLLV